MTARVARMLALGLGLGLGLAAAGCSLRPPQVGEAGPEVADRRAEDRYRAALEKYTRQVELYALLETRAMAGATYQSWPFREARAQRKAEFLAQPADVQQKELEGERAEWSAFHEFFFGVHLVDNRFDDFGTKNSVWRVALVTAKGEVLPSSIERLGRSNLNLRAYYPYLDDFWVAYRIRFPRALPGGAPAVGDDEPTVTLRVASTLGKADFTVPAR